MAGIIDECIALALERSVVKVKSKVESADRPRFIEPDDLGLALAKIRDCDAWWAEKSCLIFMAFTCVYGIEAVGATWDEIDLDNMIWTIPGVRTKSRVPREVRLSTEALEVLAYALEMGGGQGLIFPSERRGGKINTRVLVKLFSKLEISGVPLGMRACFVKWAVGRVDIGELVGGVVLGHQLCVVEERPSLRSELYERRVLVMQQWADFIAETMGPVVPGRHDT